MLKALIFCGLISSNVALAASGISETRFEPKHSRPFSLFLEGDSVILGGAGIKATYKATEKIAAGLVGKVFNLKSDQDHETKTNNSYTHKMTTVGALAEYFPMSSVDERGLYLSAAVTSASVETSTNDSLYGKGGSKDSRVGGEAKIGYQFINTLSDSANIVFQAGLGYGNAGQIRWSAMTGNNTEIGDSILFDLNAGIQF